MFWSRFYNLCTDNGTTPTAVVKTLNISHGIITKWKNGTLPNSDALIKLSNYFNCSIDYLLGKNDIKEKQVTQNEQPVSENMKLLLEKSSTLSPDEIAKTLEYVEFLKSQRK